MCVASSCRLHTLLQFQHLENDYVIFDRKIAGNAQAISKNRWIHHTSFLIDFSDAHMNNYLAVSDYICGVFRKVGADLSDAALNVSASSPLRPLSQMPKKRPEYRKDRGHGEFLVRLKEYAVDHDKLFGELVRELTKRYRSPPAVMCSNTTTFIAVFLMFLCCVW